MYEFSYALILVTSLLVCLSSQQAHPPGVPPTQDQQQQQQIHPDGHGPPQSEGGHTGGFGNQPHDAEHIKEHLKEVVDKPKEQMTEEELEFHYFKLHDYDGNNKLDGNEITDAITHFHEEKKQNKETDHEPKIFTDDEIANIVDMVLKEDDLNGDGFIEYVEFVTAQRKARSDEH